MVQFNDTDTNNRLDELRRSEEEKLVQALAPQYGLEYINLKGYTINPEALSVYPEKKAKEAKLVVFDITHNTISIAVKKPNDAVTEQALTELQNDRRSMQLYMCSTASLEHAWARYADIIKSVAEKKGMFDINPEDVEKFSRLITKKEDVTALMQKIGTINNSRRITETLELMLAGAVGLRASDIHIEPEPTVVRLRYRLDGVLHDIFDIDRYIYERLISRLKLLSGMTLNKKQEAQDGRFTFEAGEEHVDVRSSLIPGSVGESMVLRLLDASVASFTLDKITLSDKLRAVIVNELKKPNGLILTTGPTGSGKNYRLVCIFARNSQRRS
jgi:type II secretory ATPase GspE/PulE/Tfp pilus assembly ATPase PilB-like protein